MEAQNSPNFISMSEKVGLFNPKDRICLIPQMNRRGCHLLAGTFRGFGIKALVMDTYEGIDLGKEFTSGKECFPCQVTMGDILHYMKKEQERLGDAFNAENYVYFLPESEGGLTFGVGLHMTVMNFDMHLDYAAIDYGRLDYLNKFSFILSL